MNLIVLVQGFRAAKHEQLCEELAEKYGVPVDEVAEVVESFLKDTYGPAEKLAEVIQSKERPVLLFIGRKDCIICQRSQPYLEKFLRYRKDLEGVLLDYSLPEGLIYHIILPQGERMLPMIAMIFQGSIRMIFKGSAFATRFMKNITTTCG